MVYIVLGEGFEEMEAVVPCDLLRRANIPVQLAGIGGTQVTGSHGVRVGADILVEQIDRDAMDMIVLPGGLRGVQSILDSQVTLGTVQWAASNGRFVAAICAAPTVLAKLGITDGKKATCYPGMEEQMGGAKVAPRGKAVVDGKIVTSTAAGTAYDFGLALITALKDVKTAEKVAKAIVL